MAAINPLYELQALYQFKTLNLDKIFKCRYRLVTAYPMTKKIRFILENITIDDENEDKLIFVTLNNAEDTVLPIDVMRGGQYVDRS